VAAGLWRVTLSDCSAKRQVSQNDFKRLPFSCCAISLIPFEHPVCTPDGTIFDILNIVPFIKKHGINPVNGEPLDQKALTTLHFHKNNEGEYQCPVTFKTFTDNTHIVAIKTSGNVYSFEAVDRLNIKNKNWKDLLTDEKFARKDIITLQDPHQIHKRNINSFHYVQQNIEVEEEQVKQDKLSVRQRINDRASTSRILQEMDEVEKVKQEKAKAEKKVSITPSFIEKTQKTHNQAHFSNGLAAASLTSMHFTPSTQNQSAAISNEEYLIKNVREKGYIQVKTNLGDLNVELYCQDAPKTCYNFIKLCEKGAYDNTSFHRSIRGFMIQGGDPTGTGTGGNSHWGTPFGDEFKNSLSHNSRGILSMANKGANTNTCQLYFILTPASLPTKQPHTSTNDIPYSAKSWAEWRLWMRWNV
jgi:peptidyl-prolyl cis-trans isomerase-like 2